MNFDGLQDDFFVTSSQYTKTVHRDVYPAIDPTSPALSQKGKVVIITGASQGLGRYAFAASFAKAGAAAIVLVARNATELEAAAQEVKAINSDIKVLTEPMDIRDEEAVNKLFARVKSEVGSADVLINNAGVGSSTTPIGDIDPDDFWNAVEVNFKGTLLMTQSFLKLLGPTRPGTIVNITSAAAIAVIPTTAAYALSKLCQIQIQRFIAIENPNVVAVSLHPGTVLTSITKPAFLRFSKDTMALAGGTAVWLASGEKGWMNGRYLGTNWDVEELVERREDIAKSGDLLMELKGSFGKEQFM